MTFSTDIELLAELSAAFMAEENAIEVSMEEAAAELNTLLSNKYEVLTETVEGELTSFCLYRSDVDKTFLKRLYTKPSYRNRGLATKMITRLKQQGKPISLFVAQDNIRAIRYYEKLGGKEQFRAYELPARDMD